MSTKVATPIFQQQGIDPRGFNVKTGYDSLDPEKARALATGLAGMTGHGGIKDVFYAQGAKEWLAAHPLAPTPTPAPTGPVLQQGILASGGQQIQQMPQMQFPQMPMQQMQQQQPQAGPTPMFRRPDHIFNPNRNTNPFLANF